MSNAETAGHTAYSAKPPCAPFVIATTRSPTHASAPSPHASTTPITSMPGLYGQLGSHHHVAARDALEVVEVQRDRLHLHAHLAGFGRGDRDGVEAQRLERRAVFVRPPRRASFPRPTRRR